MAIIRGTNVQRWFSVAYHFAISRWTSSRLSRLRARLLAPYFESFGAQVTVSFGTRILEPGRIRIGDRSLIPNASVFDGRGGLRIGDDCLLGFENVIITSTHNSGRTDQVIRMQGMYSAPVSIGDDVWTGCRVTILPGVTIGSHAIIGAGSVVAADIPEWAVAGGVPARVIRDRRDSVGDDGR